MDDRFSFWYPVVEEVQLDFEGREYIKEILCEGHILCDGKLMCGESREVIRNKNKAKKEKTLSKRAMTPKMCQCCLDAWKVHPDSQYHRWHYGTPVKVTNVERPIVGGAQS